MNALHCMERHVKDKHAVCKIISVLQVLCMNETGVTKKMPCDGKTDERFDF